VKYNRELVQDTLKIMKRVEEIKERRQKDLWLKRIAKSKHQEKKDAVQALKHNIDWIEDVEVKHQARDDMVAIQTEMEKKRDARREAARKRASKKREVEKALGAPSARSAKQS
jgi:large subunit ribosomal protein L24e